MSYILDALRKADAQRERDASRGIHAQSVAPGASSGPDTLSRRPWAWVGVVSGVVLVAGAAWYLTRSPAAAPQVATSQVPGAQNPAPVAPASGLAMQPPIVVPPVQANAAAAPAIVPPAPPQMPVHAPPTFQPPQTSATPAVAAGLPPDAPKVAITGGVYSPNPAQRMLIVNGQVFNEGSEVAPGLSIDRIEPRTAVLKFRDGRYSVAY